MSLSLPEALALCDLDDHTGQSLTEPEVFGPLLGAAMVGELELLGRTRLVDGAISLRPGVPVSRLFESAEHVLGARPTRVETVLHALAEEDLRHTVHSFLVSKGALHVTVKRRFWWREWSWPTADAEVENDLRTMLRTYVDTADGPLCRTDMLLALLDRAGLLKTVWLDPPTERIQHRARLWSLRPFLKGIAHQGGVKMREG